MRLFIAEKPELAAAIVQGLARPARKQTGYIEVGSDVVTWCYGHMLALCDPEDYDPALKQWRMDTLPLIFRPWKYKPVTKTQTQLKLIIQLIRQADTLVHAGDPDDEGQLLIDEILHYVGNTKPVQRLLINDNNTRLVQTALASMRDNREFHGLYQSALARSVADQLYGYNLTRAYTLAARAKGFQGMLSVGRVQTPILGLVVNRDRAHESHQAHSYWVLTALLGEAEPRIQARYQPDPRAPVDSEGRLADPAYGETVRQACEGQLAVIETLTRQNKTQSAPLPYNLLKLQADANRLYQIDLDDTLAITQQLREKYRLITYNRSDCQYLSDEQHEGAPLILAAIGSTAPQLAKVVALADPHLKSSAFNSAKVSAHHAIIPTETTVVWEQLTRDEQRIYGLVARAYLAQFLPPKRYRVTNVIWLCASYRFRCSSKQTTAEGWALLYRSEPQPEPSSGDEFASSSDSDATALEQDLSQLEQGQQRRCYRVTTDKRLTQPPKRYTKATLLEDLAQVAKYVTDPRIKQLLLAKDADKASEHGGIGTPATRSSIIKSLQERGFLVEQGKNLISSGIGRQFLELLPVSCSSPDMTALWHEQQRRIQAGDYRIDQFLDHLVQFISTEVDRLKRNGLAITPNAIMATASAHTHSRKKPLASAPNHQPHACGLCGLPLSRRAAKTAGRFWWGCTGYPNCTQTYFDSKGQPDYQAKLKS